MSLLAPGWLLLGTLAVFVLLLHMRRRRQVFVPSVIIWRLLENTGEPRRSIRWPPPSLLLLLQLLVVALAVLALTQPMLASERTGTDHTIFLLDASGSMRATDAEPSRFDEAAARLSSSIGILAADEGHRFSVLAVGALPQIEVARQSSPAGILPILEGLRAGDGPADWEAAVPLVVSLVRSGETTAIVVLTDASDAASGRIAEAFPGLSISHERFAGTATANAGLTAEVTAGEAAGNWRIRGSVLFGGAEPNEVTVSAWFQPDGASGFVKWTEVLVSVPDGAPEDGPAEAPARVAVVPFSLEVELPGPGALRLALPEDAGPHDNELHFVLRREPVAPRVLYLGDPSLPLIAALQAIGDIEIAAGDELPASDATFDLVVVDGVSVARTPATNVLWVGTGRQAGQPDPPVLADTYVTGWDSRHPLSDQVDWTAIAPEGGYRVPRLPGAAVLAESGGAPLVQARTTATGREIQLAFDLTDSGWTDQSNFPVFVANLVEWLGIDVGSLVGQSCVAGAPCPVESRFLSGRILAPDGTEVWSVGLGGGGFLLPEMERSFVPDRSGLYRLEAGTESRLLAVNAVARGETALTPLGDVAAVLPRITVPPRLWWWLLAAALALLLTEALIAGTGPEQFLRRNALSATNPLAARRRLQLGVRMAGAAFFAAALAGLPLFGRAPAEDVVVIVGSELGLAGSNSNRDEFLGEIETALADDGGGARAALVAAGDANAIAADLGGRAGPAGADEDRSAGPGFKLEEAVRLAGAMLPANRTGRIVLATDGQETEGDIAMAVAALQGRGIAVDIKLLTEFPPGEVLVESVAAPRQVFAGDSFRVDAVIYSQDAGEAELTIRRAGESVLSQSVNLLAGRNRIETVIPAGGAGNLVIEVAIDAGRDTFAENNNNGIIVQVAPSPAVAVIAPQADAGDYFGNALSVQGLSADLVDPSDAPQTISDWLRYDAVVLMNTPALAFDTSQQVALEKLVKVHGRGLLILGGENSFGPGGYYQTAFERLSPLSSRVPHQMPQVAIVFVIDRSGSMNANVEDVTRLDIAKEATLTAIGLLNERSRVGVVVFDSRAHVVVPLQDAKDEAAVEAALIPVAPGGGTSIHPALVAALAELVGVDASARHIVLMTDGLTQAGDFATLLEEAEEARVTISTVAIGAGADSLRMEQIARLAGGTFHATRDFKALPSILSQETLMLAADPVKEHVAPVVWIDRGANFLAGLPESLPPVHAYVLTTAQPRADLHLAVTGEAGDLVPLLASWRFGNGKVLALATHGAGAGTEEWVRMPEYPLMWAQAIRHFLPDTQGPGLHVGLGRTGDVARIMADLLDDEGNPMTAPVVSAAISSNSATTIVLEEAGHGRYEGTFPVTEPGAYRVDVTAGELTREAMMYVAYRARFDFGRADFDKLQALAAATGGKLLLGNEPIFGDERLWVARPGWRLWTVVALMLLLVDLTIRHAPGLLGLKRRPRGTEPAR